MTTLVEAEPEPLVAWGLEVIRAMQSAGGPVLDGSFRVLTILGTSEAYFLLLALVLWCRPRWLATRLLLLFFLSSWLNAMLKDVLAWPRPTFYDAAVELFPSSGYGMPSGHAQAAVVFWGGLALWGGRRWLRLIALPAILLIGLSRVYLGVHFPTDVLGGWALGSALLGLYALMGTRAEESLARLMLSRQLRLAVALPVILMLIHPIPNSVSSMAALLGALVGLCLERHFIGYERAESSPRHLVPVALALLVFVLLHAGLWSLTPDGDGGLVLLVRFLRFALIWVWAAFGAFWLFRWLDRRKPRENHSS